MERLAGDRSPFTNRLTGEASAYLRQHMHNPVDWYPWGEEALARARGEDRPLLVSIGYSACHWCHVMERESFEDPHTADRMNALFVNVKVDREERPDVDRIYMDFVVRSQGQGGWPLTVFCTPAGRPFFGGTYFPPAPRQGLPAFSRVLEAVAQAYREQREAVERSASQIAAQLEQRPRGVAEALPGSHTLREAAGRLLSRADRQAGGFAGAPKFPSAPNLDALLAAADVAPPAQAQAALAHVTHSCREMSRRGLFDHLGGGFHRYCVDATWTIPHFEKMLYDQGLLLASYAEAWRRSGADDAELRWPVLETAAYLSGELALAEGGHAASQDADSGGQEGSYYVWLPGQIKNILGPERGTAFCAAYAVDDAGNFEGGTTHLVDVARRPRRDFAAERSALLEARRDRVAPAIDAKRVAAWNAYAVSGLARAGSLFDEAALLRDAERCARFLRDAMRDGAGRLTRTFDDGRARVPGFLEDAAAFLTACLDLYRAGVGDPWFDEALRTAEDLIARFWDPENGEFFLSPEDGEVLVQRPRPEGDGATPDAGALAGLGLYRAASLSGRGDWLGCVKRLLRTQAWPLERAPEAFPTAARLAALVERGLRVAVIVGHPDDPRRRALARHARRALTPEDGVVLVAPGQRGAAGLAATWLAGREAIGGRPTGYLCRGSSCSLPITDPDDPTAFATPEIDGARP